MIPDLPTGYVAYVDADWTAGGPDDVPAVIVGEDTIQRAGGPSFPVPAGTDPDTAAVCALMQVARSAAAVCEAAEGGPIEVNGKGAIAGAIRDLAGRPDEDGAPVVIVDCTGDPGQLVGATRRLADGGTLVLAGEPLGWPVDIDLYPDVHRRSLRVVGIPRPLSEEGGIDADASAIDEATLATFRRTLVGVPRGAALPTDGAWYRLVAGDPVE